MTTFVELGDDYFLNIPATPPDDIASIRGMRDFLDKNFGRNAQDLPGIQNSEEDKQKIQKFITDTVSKTYTGQMDWPIPQGASTNQLTGDLVNIAYGWQVLKTFSPELIVINTTNSDICHNDFSGYITNLHKADYGVGWLWNKIQNDPVLANDTIMICMPEHGRNLQPNTLTDPNGLRAYDHTSDDNSRRIFSLIVGPPGVVKNSQLLGSQSSPVGESIDIVPTIAHILGFKDGIPPGLLSGRVLNEAFS